MRSVVPILLVVLLAGCGGESEEAPADGPRAAEAQGGPVTVELDAGRPGADVDAGSSGPPDAGVATGHGADVVLRADGASFALTGTVDPADSSVRFTGPSGPTTARVAADGSFAGRITGLRLGGNRIRVTADGPGRTRWSRDIRIVRR